MNRLDRHVARIKGKLALGRFFAALGVALAAVAAAVVLEVVVCRTLKVQLPRQLAWLAAATGAAVVAAAAYAIARRPTSHQAAVLIDQRLGLDEKFSTALYAREAAAKAGAADPFAAAAVRDAERTADNVSIHKRFPLAFPNTGYWAIGLAAAAAITAMWYPQLDLFHRDAAQKEAARKLASAQSSKQVVSQQALAQVSSAPAARQADQKVQVAKAELERKLQNPKADVNDVKLSAMKVQEALRQEQREELKTSQQYAQANTNNQLFKTLNPSADDKGPTSDIAKDMAAGDFAAASEKMASLPAKFEGMKPEEQKKAAEQMKKLADDLTKMANDPAVQQHLQQTLQQNGVSQQQAKQIASLAQQAAAGSPQSQQQLQNMQQQVMKQMNNGQGPTPQQQQQIQQMTKNMQAAAGTQQQAGQMSAAAQAMAQAMGKMASSSAGQQVGAQPGGPKPGGAPNTMTQASGQRANTPGQQQGPQGGQAAGAQAQAGGQKPGGQQPGSQPGGQQGAAQTAGAQQPGGQQPGGNQPGGQQPGGQQPGGQQANGQQPGGQQPGPGQQPGGAGGGQTPQEQMANAQQQMKDALDQMDEAKHDAERMAAGQQDGSDQDTGNQQGKGDQPGNGDKPGGGGQGPGANGQPGNQPGKGMGGPGIGQGGVGAKGQAPYTVKAEMDPSQRIAGAKILSKSFIKAPIDKGEAKIQFSPADAAAYNKETDEVNEDSIPKDAQRVVKEYFNTTQSGQ